MSSDNCRIAVPGFALIAFNVRDAFINLTFFISEVEEFAQALL